VVSVARSLEESVSPKLHRSAEAFVAEGARRRVSQSLVARFVEQAASAFNDSLTSPGGRQRWMDLVQVLETACFFDPGNQEARELWLRVRWGRTAMSAESKEFFFARRRSEAWRKYVEEFGFESKCPPPVNGWWEMGSVASEFVLSAWRTYDMFKFSRYNLADWGIPYDTGGPELTVWRRQFGEDVYARLLAAPDDARVIAQVRDLFYGVLAMNGYEFVLRDAQQRQRLLKKLWPHVLAAQRAQPAVFDWVYLHRLRKHFEQIGQPGGERDWLAQLDKIDRSFKEALNKGRFKTFPSRFAGVQSRIGNFERFNQRFLKEREQSKPVQLPRADSHGTDKRQPIGKVAVLLQ
jgi:hypothetical protein